MKEQKTEKLYDYYLAIRNSDNYLPLTDEVFHNYGIDSFRDLSKHLKKHSEYGGAVKLPNRDYMVLLPFHNDVLNSWLKFDNPRVKELHNEIYELYKDKYPDRESYQRRFFHIEEDILKQYWYMPGMDTRILEAPIAGCWDKMEIKAVFLQNKGYKVKRFCFHSGKPIRGHTFVLYHDGKAWSTCLESGFQVRNRDIGKLCKTIFSVLARIPILDREGDTFKLVEFDPPAEGMSTGEYIDLIEKGEVLISKPQKKKNRSHNKTHSGQGKANHV